jgi:hypothetical protein
MSLNKPIWKLRDWNYSYSNPRAIELIKKRNPSKINWKFLSGNPAAIKLLKDNKNKIYFYYYFL